jgi:hypothetical protein
MDYITKNHDVPWSVYDVMLVFEVWQMNRISTGKFFIIVYAHLFTSLS